MTPAEAAEELARTGRLVLRDEDGAVISVWETNPPDMEGQYDE